VLWSRYVVRFSFDDGPRPSPDVWDGATAHWEARGYRCSLADDTRLVGRRGSWLGQLFGIDMRRLSCDLTVEAEDARRWSVQLLLEGKFQYLTGWSFDELALEQVLFRRALLGLPPTQHLEQFREAARRAAVIGSMTLTVAGRRVPKYWTQVIGQLAAPHEAPRVERVRR
jgi:hypothetical protein